MYLAQVLVCNHIVIFSCAVPLVFIYFIIRTPLSLPSNWLLTLSFLLGWLVDVSSDTLGVNALSCTCLAMMKRPILFAYVQHDDRMDNITPSISALGIFVYMKYMLTMVLAFCVMSFTIEYFSLVNFESILIAIISSTVLTFLILLGIDSIMTSKRERL